MELYDQQDNGAGTDHVAEHPTLRTEMAFLAENPEAFGLISDAFPVATSHLLIAASGVSVGESDHTALLDFHQTEDDVTAEAFFNHLLNYDENATALFRATFGTRPTHREQPLARYAALVAEALTLGVLRGAAVGASVEQTCVMLGSELRHGLHSLRDHLFGQNDHVTDDRDRDISQLSVSLGACRITDLDGGHYVVDVFSCGDYEVLLLDEHGMAPLWNTAAFASTPDGEADPVGRSIPLYHPAPFAILLLSGSIGGLSPVEQRNLRTTPGLIWRHRMRLEEHFLRLITACVRDKEFGERATHLFTGRCRGRDSGSGAMTVLCGGGSYEVFRSICQKRLTVLEKLISLIPEGYDPSSQSRIPTREEAETAYLRRLLDRNAGLEERVAAALRQSILHKLEELDTWDESGPLPDAPSYIRLSRAELEQVYRRYDADNREDRARIRENRRMLREAFADHWITLRPCFLTVTKDCANPARREENRRSFEACLELNRELSALLRKRKEAVSRVQALLSEGLTVLESDSTDWVCGRAGDQSVLSWAAPLTRELPEVMALFGDGWQRDSEQYRALYAAYTAEREVLFNRDVTEPYGFFARSWEAIGEGSMTDERWDELKGGVIHDPRRASYGELLDALRRISDAIALLNRRIENRAAESRTARELSDRRELRLACLRASAYEDADWGEDAVAIMSPAMRNEYRLMLRRHKESVDLQNHRAAMLEEYQQMYGTYLPK